MEPQKVYVVDEHNLPLMAMDVADVHSQNLWHRGVVLLVSDPWGRMLLRQAKAANSQKGFGLWDVVGSGHVGIDESGMDRALSFLPLKLAEHNNVVLRQTLRAGLGTGNEFVQIFEIALSQDQGALLTAQHQFMFVDQDELQALVANYGRQLSPNLLSIWQGGWSTFKSSGYKS